ncbi:hypothetical protein [Winogradskyella sp. MIT101101]|uniref:hypothetical protein n=1 Tax=Winogradskyella sp. MIT101101 TaxID=3098297 RepID=UPI00399B5DDE
MKTNSIVLILFTLLFMTSCSKDSVEDNFIESEKNTTDLSLQERNPPTGCIITPAMVVDETAATGAPYTVYASTGTNTKNYDRRVEIYLTMLSEEGNEVVADVAYVTIPANQNVSNNAAVIDCGDGLGQDPEYDGIETVAVTVKIANVLNLSNSTFDNSCSWRTTTGELPKCESSSPCAEGNDQDGDGICDDIDADNGNDTGFE